ncbi:MAG TPA: sulfatase-like hydrolase/transferase [Vicinamibacterales bacterium]|nr:sulfatase-like hydrolase/transferase [Vicinamibacterales bacterium]
MALSSGSVEAPGVTWRRWIAPALAILLLDLSLTFDNLWPTPAVTWHGAVSIELAVVLLAIAALAWKHEGVLPRLLAPLSAIWLALVVGHYADVTAPALYGREINLYWDIRYVSDVTAMLTHSAPAGLVLLVAAAVVLLVAGLFLIVRWAFGAVLSAMRRRADRRAIAALAAAAVVLFAAQSTSARVPAIPRFTAPVTATYAHQVRLVINARAATHGAHVLAPSPPMDVDLPLVKNTDVFLIFIESYGRVTYDRPAFNTRLTPSRNALGDAIRDTGRDVVSAFVESPTFGGNSWLAHISLLSGIEVKDPDTDALLMTQKRETLAKAFSRNGHRTVGWMPGLKQAWPEGAFYGFDDIYGQSRMNYAGPEFGWFQLPDEFSLAKLDQAEVDQPGRKPLFVFFPTLSTHTPFSPTPPYQPDWSKMLTAAPFDPDAVDTAYEEQIDYFNLSPYYGNAVEYAYKVIAGYLHWHADHEFVMILLGDHQPPALVSGGGASWDVPVHVIASRSTDRARILDRLRADGFSSGMTPPPHTLTHMNALLPLLLDALR